MAGVNTKVADDRILDLIFNPAEPVLGIELGEGEDEGGGSEECETDESEEVKRAKVLELQAVKVAEEGNLVEALELLTRTISGLPDYASCYNNRAQVYRLLNQENPALSDLETAIRLSNGQGKVAEQAHTQRGLIRRLQGDDEGALADFKAAANLGSQFARKQVVLMNPYAALCSQMLSQAIDNLRKGEET